MFLYLKWVAFEEYEIRNIFLKRYIKWSFGKYKKQFEKILTLNGRTWKNKLNLWCIGSYQLKLSWFPQVGGLRKLNFILGNKRLMLSTKSVVRGVKRLRKVWIFEQENKWVHSLLAWFCLGWNYHLDVFCCLRLNLSFFNLLVLNFIQIKIIHL